jgi:uncharacterized membrane protein YeaQ/YmgE (transglycosylase-associated protein family)
MVMGLGTIVPSTLGVVAPWIARNISSIADAIGPTNSITYAVGALAALTFSRTLAQRNTLLGICTVLGAVAGALVVIALFSHIAVVVLGAALGGVGGGLANSATNVALSRTSEVQDLAGLAGVKQAGAKLGGLVAGIAVPAIALWSSWRVGLLFLALVCLWTFALFEVVRGG